MTRRKSRREIARALDTLEDAAGRPPSSDLVIAAGEEPAPPEGHTADRETAGGTPVYVVRPGGEVDP